MTRQAVLKFLSLILSLVLLSGFAVTSFADNELSTEPSTDVVNVNNSEKIEETVNAIKEIKTELICVSKYGNTTSFPENSAEGILSAAESGADIVLVKVNKTSDGQIVLFSDEELSRMCVNKDGKTVNKKISQVKYGKLKTYFLRNGKGGVHEKMTAYAVPTLKQVIELLDKRAVLLIENGWEYRNDIYEILSEGEALGYTAILTNANKSSISKWQSSKPSSPLIITQYDGTVVWKSRSYIKKSSTLGAVAVLLRNNNGYSTTFSKKTVDKTKGKIRAAIDMTDPKLCGNRQDTAVYWDDVTSRGFSMIITDNVEQFIEYRLRVEQSRKILEDLIVKVSEVDLTLCSASSANSFKSNLAKAQKISENSVSAMELDNVCNSLNCAYSALKGKDDKDKGSANYSAGRIFAAVFVSILLIFAELAFEVLRNKSIALRKNGKKLFFSNTGGSGKRRKKKKKREIDFE